MKCSPATLEDLNHAVILVGVDSKGNWKVRNSWGTTWGEAGYIRVNGNKSSDCGVTIEAMYPVLA